MNKEKMPYTHEFCVALFGRERRGRCLFDFGRGSDECVIVFAGYLKKINEMENL